MFTWENWEIDMSNSPGFPLLLLNVEAALKIIKHSVRLTLETILLPKRGSCYFGMVCLNLRTSYTARPIDLVCLHFIGH